MLRHPVDRWARTGPGRGSHAGRATVARLEPGTAALYVERVGELRGRPVEWRQTLFRGDRFAFATDLADPDRMTVTGGGPLRP